MDFTEYFKDNEDDVDFCLEEVYIDLQEQLASLMEEQNVNQEEMARRMQTSPSYVSRMMHGSKNLTLKSLMKACVALGVRPEIFLQDKAKHKAFAGLQRFQNSRTMETLQVDSISADLLAAIRFPGKGLFEKVGQNIEFKTEPPSNVIQFGRAS